MGAVLKLDFEGRRLHALQRGDLIWFVLADCCALLEIDDPSMVAARLEDDQKGTTTIGTLGGQQRMLIIAEDALYEIACTSRKPVAKRFKRWLYRTVLPEIRRTGGYRGGSGPLDDLIGSLQPELPIDLPRQAKPPRYTMRLVENPNDPSDAPISGKFRVPDIRPPGLLKSRQEVWRMVHGRIEYLITARYIDNKPWYTRIMRADVIRTHERKCWFVPSVPQSMLTWEWNKTPREVMDSVLDRLGINSDLVRKTLDGLLK